MGGMGAAPTTMSNTSLINPPLLSLAVTFTETVSTSVAAGVPVKARVAGGEGQPCRQVRAVTLFVAV